MSYLCYIEFRTECLDCHSFPVVSGAVFFDEIVFENLLGFSGIIDVVQNCRVTVFGRVQPYSSECVLAFVDKVRANRCSQVPVVFECALTELYYDL